MLGDITQQIFGSINDRFIRRLTKIVQAINSLEPMMQVLPDEDIRAYTNLLRVRLMHGETREEVLIEAFAAVREAAKRVLGQRPFDVQILGGLVLHQGKIAEMKTGEGKTLVATLPAYLNALSGCGVHVVTVNDYLARRDAEWMGQVYCFLGLSVGVVVHSMDDLERRLAYACDITYVTNNELGFDYLRDNMKFRLDEIVQRPFSYAIVDEVDSILIDEARTPLVISGPSEDFSELYLQVDRLIPQLSTVHFEKDEKARAVTLTEEGAEYIESLLRETHLLQDSSLYDMNSMSLVHHVNQALRAHKLFTRDVDYIVKDDKVIIIDEFTGRMMEGRRYSDGLHQALEAKEHVSVQSENQTLASITFQNYFRLYPKLSGMTGTAMTEADEFQEIYGLEVVEIPTNAPIIRHDMNDEVYRTTREKFVAILANIRYCYARQQPALVGTTSIEKSELLSSMLKAEGIPHKVLNARYHEQEAYIISEAGIPGAVTIATNMAGRGTDIQLGGNAIMRSQLESETSANEVTYLQRIKEINREVATRRETTLKAGGLFVIGTERHESRRIDNQLRGRTGRQGDPGVSRFFLSLEDDLMRIFGSERMDKVLQKLGLQEGEAITHPWINKALERAQQKVEARNFDIRKNLLKFDDVMNDQRKIIYEQRREVMETENVHQTIIDMRYQVIDELVTNFLSSRDTSEQQSTSKLHIECIHTLGLHVSLERWLTEEGLMEDECKERLRDAVDRIMTERAESFRSDLWRIIEKNILLQILDQTWKEHLLTLDHLRQGIGLRAYGQRDPLNEYKREAFSLFERMLAQLRERVTSVLSHIEVASTTSISNTRPINLLVKQEISSKSKVRRNDPCPCGSGKKFKYCHGMLTSQKTTP